MEFIIPVYNVLLHLLYCIPMVAALLLYQNEKKRVYLYVFGMFLFYSIENLIVFMTEYSKEFSELYNSIFITMPTIRTIIFTAVLLFMLLIVCSTLKQRRQMPLLVLLVLIILFLLFVPIMEDSAIKSFIYYLPCQLYSFLVAEYGLRKLRKGAGSDLSDKVRKAFHSTLRCCSIFSLLIILEDYIVIFHYDNYGIQSIDVNNRSYTENVMTIWFAFIAIYLFCGKILEKLNTGQAAIAARESLKEPLKGEQMEEETASELPLPVVSTSSGQENDSDYSKFYLFCREYQLTTREQDILKLLLQDKNNNEISEALVISVGTAKAHVHNVFAKVDVNRRKDLLKIYEEYEPDLEIGEF